MEYRCDKTYDGGEFLTYPMGSFVAWAVTMHQMHDSSLSRRDTAPAESRDIEAFLQEWLFFGLTLEFLRNYVSSAQLMRHVESNGASVKVLSTSVIPDAIERWVKDTQARSDRNLQDYEHLSTCLHLARANINSFKTYINQNLVVMLASLGELYTLALGEAFEEVPVAENLRKPPSTWLSLVNQDYWVKRMKISRFCPSQIVATLAASSKIHGIYFVVHMLQPDITGGHDMCNETACCARQRAFISATSYRTRHVDDQCSCDFFIADDIALSWPLTDGYLPLIRFREDSPTSRLDIDIISSKDSPKYLALSHVWADGLGNWEANALPMCQLKSIRLLIQNLRSSLNLPKHQELLLWCDTLCCPVGPADLKSLALSRMKRTYEEASCVLVLDSSLRYYDCAELLVRERAYRIVTSAWSRRLWTLQEAMLSIKGARLWFQFRDTAINVQALVDGILHGFRG